MLISRIVKNPSSIGKGFMVREGKQMNTMLQGATSPSPDFLLLFDFIKLRLDKIVFISHFKPVVELFKTSHCENIIWF